MGQQYNWIFLASDGKRHSVGIFHGKKTGHVMIYCNMRIIQIDFNVWESKSYSFFIDEELCEIHIERKGNTFFYRFDTNKKVDTPLNRLRKQTDRKYLKQSLLFFGALILAALVGVFAIFLLRESKKNDSYLDREGIQAIAGLTVTETDTSYQVAYSFVAGTDIVEGKQELPKSAIPLRTGDEFLVLYFRSDPTFHRLQWDNPTAVQVQRYKQRVTAHWQALAPDQYLPFLACQVDIAYDLEGLQGLETLYAQETTAREAFLRLTRDPVFVEQTRQRCY